MKIRKQQIIAPLCVLAIIAALGFETSLRATPADAEPYHARVRQAKTTLPMQVGEWSGVDMPDDVAAESLLRPNVLISRRYQNSTTGEVFSFLLVHCRDANDMNGHFPPVCYPGQGFTEVSSTKGEIVAGGLKVPETHYDFLRISHGRMEEEVIYNFMILPDGRIVPNMDGIRAIAKSYTKRFFGAGQIQMIFPVDMPPDSREETVREFIVASKPLIETILSGVER